MEGIRLDRWLWAARFYRTRARAVTAIDGGKVKLNGSRPRRSKAVKEGDLLTIRKGPFEYEITVIALSHRRGSASDAQRLYEESADSIERREVMRAQLKSAPTPGYEGRGRPTKKERRMLDRLKDDFR